MTAILLAPDVGPTRERLVRLVVSVDVKLQVIGLQCHSIQHTYDGQRVERMNEGVRRVSEGVPRHNPNERLADPLARPTSPALFQLCGDPVGAVSV